MKRKVELFLETREAQTGVPQRTRDGRLDMGPDIDVRTSLQAVGLADFISLVW